MTSADTQSTLRVTNLAGTTITLASQDILALRETTVNAELACYGTPLSTGDWQGVRLSDILNLAGMEPSVAVIIFEAADGYSVSIAIDTAMRSDVIIAYELNGTPLQEGYRLTYPGANGNLWIAMIKSITMSASLTGVNTANKPGGFYQNQPPANFTTSSTTPQPIQSHPTITTQPTETPQMQPAAPATNPTSTTQSPSGQQTAEHTSTFPVWILYYAGTAILITFAIGAFVRYKRLKLRFVGG
ncbi:MAG TPA: molybdopterin-dependent oxidoreductase [Candidatus Binatia bacterium]|nr:molybdopterin-dependent oxidoreductase [Candidatus Binatia bacterium]